MKLQLRLIVPWIQSFGWKRPHSVLFLSFQNNCLLKAWKTGCYFCLFSPPFPTKLGLKSFDKNNDMWPFLFGWQELDNVKTRLKNILLKKKKFPLWFLLLFFISNISKLFPRLFSNEPFFPVPRLADKVSIFKILLIWFVSLLNPNPKAKNVKDVLPCRRRRNRPRRQKILGMNRGSVRWKTRLQTTATCHGEGLARQSGGHWWCPTMAEERTNFSRIFWNKKEYEISKLFEVIFQAPHYFYSSGSYLGLANNNIIWNPVILYWPGFHLVISGAL